MKKLLFFSAFIMLSVLFFSCSKKDDAAAPAANPFTATVDGKAWTSSSVAATYRYGIFALTGKSADGSVIIIRVRPMAGMETSGPIAFYYQATDNVGVYMIKETDTTSFISNIVTFSPTYNPMLAFTKFDKGAKTAAGTFDIKVKRPTDNKVISITGSFTVTYDDQIPPTPGKTMTAKVDGAAWTASAVNCFSSSMTQTLQVIGNGPGGTTIALTLPYHVGAGTYSISQFGSYMGQYNPTASTYIFGKSGSVTISSHDLDAKVIKGSFSFVADDGTITKTITEGSFVGVY